MVKQLSLVLIGGGDRGSSYLKYLQQAPEKFRLAGIAEPVEEKREYLRKLYHVPQERCFSSYEALLSLPKFADVAMICTQDQMHFAPAMMAMKQSYDILMEKPISVSPEECCKMYRAAKEAGVKSVVCHVLRYTPFYKTIKQLILSGTIGEIMNINHTEGVGNVHMSHSYVRGNWRKTAESSPMLLAKCCHDTDLLQWLVGELCTKVQSMGSLSYFCGKNKPKGAPKRCLDGCPHKDTCYYYAPALYRIQTAEVQHFRAIVANHFDPSDEELDEILKTSPYGRCVYQCDNDVVDHQIVNLQFGADKFATLTMSGFNKGGRVTTIMGTKGELRADMEKQTITFYSFATRETTSVYQPKAEFDQTIAGGHGGGDMGIMEDLYDYLAYNKPSDSISDLEVSCMSHLICFAAEEARAKGVTIDMEDYWNRF